MNATNQIQIHAVEATTSPISHEFIGKGVLTSINQIQAEIAKQGIGRKRDNRDQNYKYRSIDDIYNLICSLYAEYGLICIPKTTQSNYSTYTTKSGSVMHCMNVVIDYHFVALSDGSSFTATMSGTASDNGDKAMAKACSIAHKNMLTQLFNIPTMGSEQQSNQNYEQYNSRQSSVTSNGVTQEMLNELQNALNAVSVDPDSFLRKRNLTISTLTPNIIGTFISEIEQYISKMNHAH